MHAPRPRADRPAIPCIYTLVREARELSFPTLLRCETTDVSLALARSRLSTLVSPVSALASARLSVIYVGISKHGTGCGGVKPQAPVNGSGLEAWGCVESSVLCHLYVGSRRALTRRCNLYTYSSTFSVSSFKLAHLTPDSPTQSRSMCCTSTWPPSSAALTA